MEHLFSIMNLDADHLDEICEDIRTQFENKVTTCALFKMTLVPEGTPPTDKAKLMCEKYALFKEKLDSMNVPSGVLIQASIGHGWKLGEKFPFQNLLGMVDGIENPNVVCPYDEGFKEYMYNTARTIALCNPHHIMVDDDFRIISRSGRGCGCPLHMKRFNALSNLSLTREELLEKLSYDTPEAEKLNEIFIETQKESLLNLAKAIRKGIDSANSKIPGSICTEGCNTEFGGEIAKILAGENNPTVLRVNNGYYARGSTKFFTRSFYKAACQITKVKDSVDVILAETDTCPQNRYSTGAMSLHTHFTGSLLEGIQGAKHWITRLNSFEMKSGIAYRKVLSKHSGFYEALAKISKDIVWHGFRMSILKKPYFRIRKENSFIEETYSAWGMCVLERMGLPMYFSSENGGILCLDGEVLLSDSEIMEALKGTVLLSSESAQYLIARGFGEFLGISVSEHNGKPPMGERIVSTNQITTAQTGVKELIIKDETASVLSYICTSRDKTNYETLFPGSVLYKNSLGGTIVTFSGTPRTNFTISEAFSFLNETRKEQFIDIFKKTGELFVYFPGDEEVYLRAGFLPDGKIICAVFNLGFDPIEKLSLSISTPFSKIEKLTPDGALQEISFTKNEENFILDTPCNTLDPVILFIF